MSPLFYAELQQLQSPPLAPSLFISIIYLDTLDYFIIYPACPYVTI